MSVRTATLASRNLRAAEAPMAAVLLVSVATGAALAVEPVLALLPIAALASALLLVSGRARIIVVVLGGLLIFQREEGLNMSKMAFLVLFAVAFVGAFHNIRTMRDTPAYRLARPLLAASTAFGALVALSMVVAYNNGIPLGGAWLRDIAPYLLFASAPMFALDAQAALSQRALVALLVGAGTIGAVSFAISWLERRDITDLGVSSIGLASLFVPAALFAYGMSATLHAGQTRWLAVSTFVLALLLVTGTRTNLVLLIAPIAVALGARHRRAIRSFRLILLAPIAIAITLVLSFAVIRLTNANEQHFSERIAIFKSTGSASDSSYIERRRQTRVARTIFESNPIVGSGAGTTFDWETVDGQQVTSFFLDTPLTFPAKFGVLGLAILAFVIGSYFSFTRALLRMRAATVENLALIGFLAVVALSAVAASPFEDKGFSFGLMLTLALALANVNRNRIASGEPLLHSDLLRPR